MSLVLVLAVVAVASPCMWPSFLPGPGTRFGDVCKVLTMLPS